MADTEQKTKLLMTAGAALGSIADILNALPEEDRTRVIRGVLAMYPLPPETRPNFGHRKMDRW